MEQFHGASIGAPGKGRKRTAGDNPSVRVRRLAAALLALGLSSAALGEPASFRIVYEPLPGAQAEASRLGRSDPERLRNALDLVGLADPGPPIHVVLAPEGSAPARDVPAWISGYTDGVSGIVVLLPARTPGYPDDGLAEVLDHEITHVLVARATGGRTVPRWFDEGLALVSERSFGLRDRGVLSLPLLLTKRVSLNGLNDLFHGSGTDARKAYALSLAVVSDLLERHGRGLPRAIFRRMRAGDSFAEAFRDVTGTSVSDADALFWERQRSLSRWLPLVTSGTALWLAILTLSVLAFARRRRAAAAAHLAWEAEELAAQAAQAAREAEIPDPPPEQPVQ